jgi:hypothetical protein
MTSANSYKLECPYIGKFYEALLHVFLSSPGILTILELDPMQLSQKAHNQIPHCR